MGLLVDGKWQDRWYDTKTSGGKFIREDAQFRSWITPDGSAGPTGDAGFKAAQFDGTQIILHAALAPGLATMSPEEALKELGKSLERPMLRIAQSVLAKHHEKTWLH